MLSSEQKLYTPESIDDKVSEIIEKIGSNLKPLYLKVERESYSIQLECFPNVAEKIRRDGGKQVLGWKIWKTPNIVEAEFHCVWKSPKGTLVDVTPVQTDDTRILFLPDSNAKYKGAQIDNVRINISGNRLVDDVIAISRAEFRFLNKGKRAHEYRIEIKDQEIQFLQQLTLMKIHLIRFINEGFNRNSQCFCQSGQKYKRCHGKQLSTMLSKM